MEMETFRDWEKIPGDVLQSIADLSQNHQDYVRFRSVCPSWRSATAKKPHIPWILVEYLVDELGKKGRHFALCNFPNKLKFQPPTLQNGIASNEVVGGSSLGWIALLNANQGISLYNPFTGDRFRLPSFDQVVKKPSNSKAKSKSKAKVKLEKKYSEDDLTRLRRDSIARFFSPNTSRTDTFFTKKIILSTVPSDPKCILMALAYDRRQSLIYCNPRGESWSELMHPFGSLEFDDMVYYKDKFYAVSHCRVFMCEIHQGSTTVTEILRSPESPLYDFQPTPYLNTCYLVESCGDLLLALTNNKKQTLSWEVFHIDFYGEEFTLRKLEDLGGRSLFLGHTSSSISVPKTLSLPGDCVYFIHMYYREVHPTAPARDDMICVFNMATGTTRYDVCRVSDLNYWITPNYLKYL